MSRSLRFIFAFACSFFPLATQAEFTVWDRTEEVVAGVPVFSENSLSITPTVAGTAGAVGVISQHSVSSGKHYFESTTDCGPDSLGFAVGVATSNPLLPSRPYLWSKGWAVISDGLGLVNNSERYPNGRQSTVAGDVFMVALDADEGHVFFGKNGVWLDSGDPSTGANPAFFGLPEKIFAALEVGSRQCSDPLMTVTTNFGQSDFSYEVPTGYFKGFCADSNCPVAGPEVLNTFVNGEVADADRMNANFELLLRRIESLENRAKSSTR